MKKLMFLVAIGILVAPLYSQDGGPGGGGPGGGFGGDSIDLSGILGDRGGRGGPGGPGGGGRGGFQIPDSKTMFQEIQSALKKGKTPLEKSQEKPVQSLLDKEIVALSDKIQLLRNTAGNNGGFPGGDFPGGGPGGDFPGGFPGGDFPPGGFPGGNFPGGFPGGNFPGGFPGGNVPAGADTGGGNGARGNPGGQPANTPQASQQANALAIQTDTITSLKNEDFLTTKLSLFLSSDQMALVQKVHAADKANVNCLDGLLDRYSTQQQNPGRGNNGQNRGFNNNTANNATKPNGQKYCMAPNATPSERLEPIRKVLADGNLPLAKEKDGLAEIVMKSELQDLDLAQRTSLTGGNRGGRGGFNNSRDNNPQQVIQSTTDNIYKKVAALLNPPQVESLKKWQYTQMQDRGGIETLIAVEAMQDTPLTNDQITRVTTAWTELRTQLQQAARQANKKVSAKEIDAAAMNKLLNMLEPAQVASYQLAQKYGPQAAGK